LQKDRAAFSIYHVKDSFIAVFRQREGPNRRYILSFIAIAIFTIMPFIGEYSISYNYVRTRYKWGVDEYSTYQSITSASNIVGQAIFIPLVAMLGVNEAWIMTIVFGSTTLRHLIKGLAVEPWMYYFAAMIDIVGSYAMAIMKSMLSTCVAPNELGKVYAFLSALDSLLPIGIAQAYASIWKVWNY
jgi:hypothetical protein